MRTRFFVSTILAFLLVFVLAIGISFAETPFLPAENPTSTAGLEFVVPIAGAAAPGGSTGSTVYVTAIYDNTRVDFDMNADGIADNITYINKSQTIGGTAGKNDLPAGTWIRANKPVLVVQRGFGGYEFYGHTYGGWGFTIPKAAELGTDYYVPTNLTGNVVYVTAAYSNTTLWIDSDNNGVYEYSTSLMPTITYTNTTLFAGAHLHADKPIVVVQKAYGDPGTYSNSLIYGYDIRPGTITRTDYYVPLGNTVYYVTALNDSTKIYFDTNDDGIYDRSIIVGKSNVSTWTDLPASTHIHANNSIIVTMQNTGEGCIHRWGSPIPKASELGTDYYVPTNLTGNVVYVTAAYSNTTLQIDNDNNGIFEFSTSLVPGATYTNTTLFAGAHLHADKPIVVVQKAYPDQLGGYCVVTWGYEIDSVAIDTSQEILGLVDFNINISAKVRTTNPTSATIYNLSYNLTWPANFSFSGGGSNITVTRYNLTNDAVVAGPQSLTSLIPTCGATICNLTITKTDFSTTLNQLLPGERVEVEIKLTTPATPQVNTFGRVNLTYAAKGWRWVWP